jgi:glycine oxidase
VSAFDVAKIGGGLIGGSIAFELSAEKLRVVLFDRQHPGQEASSAAAGMLSPGPDSPEALPLVPLMKESLRIYPEFVAGIENSSGQSAEFAREGTLQIFLAPQGESERDALFAEYRRLGLPTEPLSLDAAHHLEPSLGPGACAAAFLPDEATVNPRSLTCAVMAAAQRRGVEIRTGCAVTSVLRENDRCTGVVAVGEKISAKHVVVAAGCFSAGIAPKEDWLTQYVPTRPVRGQMVALRPKGINLRHVLRSEQGYIVPRRDGRAVAGSTLEDAGFDKHVTPAGLQQILRATLELAPALAEAEILETWAGLRPGTPDDLPILGPTGIEGLLIATGHYRNGILLAPVTAKLLREWITSGQTSFNTEIFSPERFTRPQKRAGAQRDVSTLS